MEFKLQEQGKELLNVGSRKFILSLTEVSYVDSFGIGQMFSIWCAPKKET